MMALLDAMNETFTELCLANLRRTARLCRGEAAAAASAAAPYKGRQLAWMMALVAIARAVVVTRLNVTCFVPRLYVDAREPVARPPKIKKHEGGTLLVAGNRGVPLAVWALELARDAAEAAIRFVHTYDHSSMALGELWAVVATLPEDSQVGVWLVDSATVMRQEPGRGRRWVVMGHV